MRRFWTVEEIAFLREYYPTKQTVWIAEALGRTVNMVHNQAHKQRLRKTESFLQDPANNCRVLQFRNDAGEAYRFKKGQVPPNKGLRRPGWAPGRMADTQFKKGHRKGIAALKWKPVGTISPDTEGYLRIKVREAVHGKEATGFGNTKVWPLYHRQVWQEHHGPIPEKHLVIFKDGDRSNCAIENLELISMADNARRNSMWNSENFPREVAEVIQLAGALKRRIRNLEKTNGTKQN